VAFHLLSLLTIEYRWMKNRPLSRRKGTGQRAVNCQH